MELKANYKDCCDLEYRLGIMGRQLDYNTKDISVIDLLKQYKNNKKYISVGMPLTDYKLINTNIFLMITGIQPPSTFVVNEDFTFVVGYHELKYLYRWMFKGVPLIYDDKVYYYKEMPERFRRKLENSYVRVRVYNRDADINTLLRRHFSSNILIGSQKIKNTDETEQ